MVVLEFVYTGMIDDTDRLIAKFLQFQPEVQQKFFNCRHFDYSVVVFFKVFLTVHLTSVP